jgi:hypothetical protein
MNIQSAIRGILVALVVICTAALPASGQAGLLRRAQQAVTASVGNAVTGETSSGTSAEAGVAVTARSEARESEFVLTMRHDVLDRFGRATEAELAVLTEWAQFEQRFTACQGQMYANPSMLHQFNRLSEDMARQMESGSTEAMIAASEAYQAGMDALMVEHCGASQSEFTRRQGAVNDDALSAALNEGRFTETQYAMIKERVVPFCLAGGTSARIAGPEGEHFYVYEPEEVEALAARCDAIMPALERTI